MLVVLMVVLVVGGVVMFQSNVIFLHYFYQKYIFKYK